MSRRALVLALGPDDHRRVPGRLRFRRALTVTAMTVLVPGSAHLALGRRRTGWAALGVWVVGVVALVVTALVALRDRAGAIGFLADADTLLAVRLGIVVLAAAWLALFVDAWRLVHPGPLPGPRAALVVAVNLAIIAGVSGTAAYSSQVVGVSREVVTEVFTETETSEPLEGRYNILLIGADSGAERFGIRPDSMTVVSLDADTGSTVLVSLPRNLENVPFPEDSPMRDLYPFGFSCGDECLLNAVHTAAEERTDLYPGSDDPGLEATIDAVEGATDLTINYYVMVNLSGFSSLVDAVGGVDMDIRSPIAMFGKEDLDQTQFIEPGRQTLDGNEALWYARSRVQSDDYTRMGRQKCLLSAMLDQLSPQSVLLNATEIARSGRNLLSTDIPATELGQFADLALKSRGEPISTVSLVPPVVNTQAPDFDVIHQLIADAIAGEGAPATTATPTAPTGPTPTVPSLGSTATPDAQEPTEDDLGEAANNADDITSIC